MPSTATSILDGLSTSVAVKAPCRTVSSSNIALAGLQTIAGYTTVENDRVLVIGQTNPVENGIYMASTGSWTRSRDADGNRDLVQGTIVLVRSAGADGAIYELTTANPIVIGTSALTFELRDDPAITYAQKQEEIDAGVTPTNYSYEPYSVLRYGAVADGVPATGAGTDNTAAFQRAIDVAAEFGSAGGGVVYVPAGVYKLNSALEIPPGVTVRGDGKWSSLLFCPSAFSDTDGLIQFNGAGGPPAGFVSMGVITQTGGSGGNGIVITSNGTFLNDLWVGGFASGRGVILNSTDVFLENFAIELCLYGVEVLQVHINVINGTLYSCSAAGALIANNSSVENGRVVFDAIRATDCAQDGFLVSAGKCVTFTGCSSIATDNTKNTNAGIRVDSSSDVVVDGFAGRVTGTVSAAGAGILLNSSTDIAVSGGKVRGFQDGLRVTSCSDVSVTGGNYRLNGRRGVYASAGDNINISGVVASDNSESGIYSANSDASCNHSIVGCTAQSNTTYGIYSNLTGSGSYTNLAGNTARLNSTKNISVNGTVTSHAYTGNLPDYYDSAIPSVASAAALTLPSMPSDLPRYIISVTGTTTITSITATGWFGRTVTLHLISGADLTDGGNLTIGGNFTATSLSTITLFCNGTDWFEVSRSSNS